MRHQKELEGQRRKRRALVVLGAALLLIVAKPVPGLAQEIPFDTNVPSTDDSGTDSAPAPGPGPAVPGADAPAAQNLQSETPQAEAAPQAETLASPSELPKTKGPQGPADLSNLDGLAPFSDIAVITKRFLPKTHRFEFTPNVGLVLNDAFFNDFILGARLGFYFSENWGIEANAMSISSSNKSVTNELASQAVPVQTTSIASPTSFYGLDIKWAPIYGKLALMNKRIVPFDLFFTFGGGVTGTSQNTHPPTGHVGVGQLFAISKWLAFRWDIGMYGYRSTSQVNGTSNTFTNLDATIGFSFFFPSAEYR